MLQEHTVPLARLLSICRRLGYRVTSSQLHRWRAAGLLSRPRRVGQGRGRGTVSHYPEENVLRILVLCEALDRSRNLSRAGWTLWALGFAVEPFVRREMVRMVTAGQQWAESVVEAQRTGKTLRVRHRGHLGRLIRQSHRDPAAGARMVAAFSAAVRGTDIRDVEEARDLFDDLLAALIPRALRMLSPEQRAKLGEGDVAGYQPNVLEAIQTLGREAPPAATIRVLKKTSDEELRQLRDELVGQRKRLAAEMGFTEMDPPSGTDFLSYFRQRWISPTFRPAHEAFLNALELRPPPPPLAPWLIERKLPELIASATPPKRKR